MTSYGTEGSLVSLDAEDIDTLPGAASEPPTLRGVETVWSEALFASVLEATEIGIVVLDGSSGVRYMNASARRMLATEGELPQPLFMKLGPMLARVETTGAQSIERWTYGDLVFRARLSSLEKTRELTVLELTVTHVGSSRDFAAALSRGLQLRFTDARLLTMLWRGLRNDEIAQILQIPVGTVKSRLYRLYQTLGVRNRAGAVLCAANVLGGD